MNDAHRSLCRAATFRAGARYDAVQGFPHVEVNRRMIEVRKGEDGDFRLKLVVAPPEKHDAGVDPSLAVERLFSILARGSARQPVAVQSTQPSPESR